MYKIIRKPTTDGVPDRIPVPDCDGFLRFACSECEGIFDISHDEYDFIHLDGYVVKNFTKGVCQAQAFCPNCEMILYVALDFDG